MRFVSRLSPLLVASLIAGCTSAPPPKPAPLPPPEAAPTSPPIDWRDLAETKGNWRYVVEAGATLARFETATGAAVFTIRCDRATRRVTLARADAVATVPLTVTTSYGSRTLAPATLAASDALLDQIAFSRGRFTIEAAGLPELVLPAWAEPGRVIEDCRS